MARPGAGLTRYAKFAWGTVALNLGVILWGAVVRATGSGAGCGSHWPDCDGSIVPALEDSTTAIEFGHRLTSGLALVAVIALVVAARKQFARDDRVYRASQAALGFIVIEVLIGAALVTFGWVDDDTSTARVIAIAVHLGNTFLLLGALTVTAWWAGGKPAVRLDRRGPVLAIGAGLAALLAVAGLGAITALGDTLFPDAALADDFRGSSHYLVRLRTIHPVSAVVAGGYVLLLARSWAATRDRPNVPALAGIVSTLIVAQIALGVVNVALAAPLWMQLVHLLAADLMWIAVVLLGAAGLAEVRVREPA